MKAVAARRRRTARRLDRTLAAAPPVPGPLRRRAARRRRGVRRSRPRVDVARRGGQRRRRRRPRRARASAAEHGLLPLEIAADRAAFAGGERGLPPRAARTPRSCARHLGDRADARNAATLLALAGAPPAADALVPGGRRSRVRRCGALAALREAGAVRAAIAAAFAVPRGRLASPWQAERALERGMVRSLRREARSRPLSLAVPLAYLAVRRAEVRRIALVLRGAALGLPADELLDLVEA